MRTETFHLELITPCFCGGAEPDQQAEIRAASIRGQLRWWFRTLGGFKSLAPEPVPHQEAMIFGSTAGDEGHAGKLIVRVHGPQPRTMRVSAEDLGAGMNTPLGYALFPLRPFGESDGKRGKIAEATKFAVTIVWRGSSGLWTSLCALVAVWGHLGALGFRSRRAVGALQLKSPDVELFKALGEFAAANNILVRELNVPKLSDWRSTSAELLKWYRSWRQHGQMNQSWVWNDRRDKKKGGRWVPIPAQQKEENRSQPGFACARRDHNEGLDVQGAGAPNPDSEKPAGKQGETFRPALGLPIIQFFSSLGDSHGPLKPKTRATVTWDESWSAGEDKGEGRFASPVLLRPHRDVQGNWHALVIFVDAHKWPDGKPVYLNGQERQVAMVTLPDGTRSPALYEAMKHDNRLSDFLG